MNKVTQILDQRDLMAFLPPDVELRSVGRDQWRGRCPFTQGDPGAFAVRRHARGHLVFKCFSCSETGTVIDLVMKLEGCSALDAIRMLSTGTTEISREAQLQRVHDQMTLGEGYAVLACDNPKCGRTKEVKTELDAVIMMSGGSNWEVAPDGIGALCWSCA